MHPLNAIYPISVIVSGSFIDYKLEQPENNTGVIFVMLSGISIVIKFIQPAKSPYT